MISRLSIYCCSLLLLASLFQRGHANEVTSQKMYTVDITHKIKFFFNETDLPSPDSLPDNADNLDDLRRLTQIYYLRLVASEFSQSFKGVQVDYTTHKWLTMDMETDEGVLQYDFTDLIMAFELLIRFKDDEILPGENDVLEAILTADPSLYTSNFVRLADPKNIFETANSTRISATIQKVGTPPPTAAPVVVIYNSTSSEFPVPARKPTAPPTMEESDVIIDVFVDGSDEALNVTSNPPNTPLSEEEGSAGDMQQVMIRGGSIVEKEANSSSARQTTSMALALGLLAVGLFL